MPNHVITSRQTYAINSMTNGDRHDIVHTWTRFQNGASSAIGSVDMEQSAPMIM